MKQVTLKKVSTNEQNISKRHITYDLYIGGKYTAHFSDIHDALEAQAEAIRALENTTPRPAVRIALQNQTKTQN